MRTVADFTRYAEKQWVRRFPRWLSGEDDPLAWPLEIPSEATALDSPDAVAAWASAWRRVEGDGIAVEWVERSWHAMGVQRLPARVRADANATARLTGRATAWQRARHAVELLRSRWPEAQWGDAIQRSARRLGTLDGDDAVRLLDVLAWLEAHPDTALREREFPIEGVDTKWHERHRTLLEALLPAIKGDVRDLSRGVRFLVRLPGEEAAESRLDLAALKDLRVEAQYVLICENKTSVSSLPAFPGTAVVHGMGFAAPSLADIPWIREAAVYYWGDLDTFGFLILGRLRSALPEVRSIMMDEQTLDAWRPMAVTEPGPYRGEIGYLTISELRALARVRSADLRLEQERIGRDYACAQVSASLGALS